jgi:hypothetical protein
MSNFVEITKAQFDAFMEHLGFDQVEPNHPCKEAVYDQGFGDHGCFVRVYSTIATGDVGRDVGKDAIRVVAVSPGGDVFLRPCKRVHRTKNWRKNLLDRIDSVHKLNPQFEERPCSCGGTLRTRAGRHGAFLGCSEYPRCRITAQPNPLAALMNHPMLKRRNA